MTVTNESTGSADAGGGVPRDACLDRENRTGRPKGRSYIVREVRFEHDFLCDFAAAGD